VCRACVQVLCASVIDRPPFYEDDLVHNYLCVVCLCTGVLCVYRCVMCTGVSCACVQVLCASITDRPPFYEDDLVHNYLQFARRRFDELNSLRQRQCDEMRRRLSTDLHLATSY